MARKRPFDLLPFVDQGLLVLELVEELQPVPWCQFVVRPMKVEPVLNSFVDRKQPELLVELDQILVEAFERLKELVVHPILFGIQPIELPFVLRPTHSFG